MRKPLLPRRSTIGRYHRREHVLTSREREVLLWLARGKSNAEIGTILGISSATVGKHLEHIYPKLGVENRTAAASFASTLSSPLTPAAAREAGAQWRRDNPVHLI